MMVRRALPRVLVLLALGLPAACSDDSGGSSSGGGSQGEGGQTGTSSGAGTTTATTTSTTATTATTTGTGSGGGGGAGGEAPVCDSGLDQPIEACQTCQDANCCISATQAAKDPGIWTSSSATICREANCFEECGVAEPECGGIQPTPASCTEDLYEACCAEVTACAESDECAALIYICIDDRGCNPFSECYDQCAIDLGLADGLPLFDAFYDCFLPVVCD